MLCWGSAEKASSLRDSNPCRWMPSRRGKDRVKVHSDNHYTKGTCIAPCLGFRVPIEPLMIGPTPGRQTTRQTCTRPPVACGCLRPPGRPGTCSACPCWRGVDRMHPHPTRAHGRPRAPLPRPAPTLAAGASFSAPPTLTLARPPPFTHCCSTTLQWRLTTPLRPSAPSDGRAGARPRRHRQQQQRRLPRP